MQPNKLFIMLSFTTFIHTSLCLVIAEPSPVNSTITIGSSSSLRNRQTPSVQLLKQIYFCSGRATTAPPYDCPPTTCESWHNYLDHNYIRVPVPHTNCIDTDCDTNFRVCNKHHGDDPHHCTYSNDLIPGKDPQGRCIYDVPGTERVYIWA
jgi:hypothetical protein